MIVGSGYLTPNHKSYGVRAPRNNGVDLRISLMSEEFRIEVWQS